MISTTLRAVMIYQVCDLDKKILQKMYPFLQYFLVEHRGLDSRANLRKRCGASLMNLLRKYHTRSSAVADVHRKSALYRSSFESPPTQKKKSKPNRKGLLLTFLGGA